LHYASISGNVRILERIWKWAKEQLTTEELNKLLLTLNYYRATDWHVAARWGKVKVLNKLFEWAKEVQSTLLLTYALHGAESFLRI
jgi:hypothetical protein